MRHFEDGKFFISDLQSSNGTCSNNGEKLQSAIMEIAQAWLENGSITWEEYDYLEHVIAYPWSMVDKITPWPHPEVEQQLIADGLEEIRPSVWLSKAAFWGIHLFRK